MCRRKTRRKKRNLLEMTDHPGVFQSAQLQFDDFIRLPASGKLLAAIEILIVHMAL